MIRVLRRVDWPLAFGMAGTAAGGVMALLCVIGAFR
jgi:hypothetical protein